MPTSRPNPVDKTRPAPRKGNRARNQMLITGGVLGLLALGLLIAAMSAGGGGDREADSSPKEVPTPPPLASSQDAAETQASADPQAEARVVSDDGRMLWASPTAGEPLATDYLPPGVQFVLWLRPRAMLDQRDAELALQSLGPGGERLLTELRDIAGLPLRDLKTAIIAIRPGKSYGQLDTSVIYTTATAAQVPSNRRGWNYANPAPGVIVAASPETLAEIDDLGGAPLRREMEMLIDASDAERHVSLLAAPNFLFGEGQVLFSGEM